MVEAAGGGEVGDRWVFGYGSLMWRPGFPFLERRAAVLKGRRRAFCISSVHHRGTYARPGLVLGLLPGEGVRGAAYRIAAADWPATYGYLREREQPTETYVEARVRVALEGGAAVEALTFLSDEAHPQWAGDVPLARQAELIAGARGLSGGNADYLRDLVAHLRAEGCADPGLEALLRSVEVREAAGDPEAGPTPPRSGPPAPP